MGIRSISLNSACALGFTAEIYSTVLNYYYKSIVLVFSPSPATQGGRLSNNDSKSMATTNKARPAEPLA